jgi:hypothetical protein
MSYQKSTSTDPEDLIQDLFTFLTGTPGWTQLYLNTSTNRAAITKAGASGQLTFVFEWTTDTIALAGTDLPSPVVEQDNYLWPGSSAEFNFVSDTSSVQRVNTLTGPYQNVWFFEDDNYCHVVVEYATGQFRHFGFGEIIKVGSWTGGQYQYGHYWNQSASFIDDPTSVQHFGWFGGNIPIGHGTLHVRCGPNFPGAESALTKWLQEDNGSINDGDGDPKGIVFNGGGHLNGFLGYGGAIPMSQYNGFKPLHPEPLFHVNDAAAPDQYKLLGFMPDRRYVNMDGLVPGEEITVGSEIWIPFPIVRKRYSPGDDTEQSWNFGVAYRKVTA